MAKEELFSDPNNEHSSGSSSHNNDKNNPLLGTQEPESLDDFSFKILHEEVGDTDAFDNGTHKRISETFFNLVTTQEKAATIGLEGEWGSGKSTVINLLRKRLEEASDTGNEPDNTSSESNPVIGKTLFFNFDTWSHEGDTLRKSFLEELCDAASESLKIEVDRLHNRWWEIGKKGIKENIKRRIKRFRQFGEEATGKRLKRTVDSTKSLSWFGRIASAIAVTVPLGVALLRDLKWEHICFWNCGPSAEVNLTYIIGAAMLFSPAFVWAIFSSSACVLNFFRVNEKKFRVQFFNPNFSETSVQLITEDKDRTSLEFKKYFHRILTLALEGRDIGNGQEKEGEDKIKSKGLEEGAAKLKFERVIIIIDNLDRIESDHAKAVWQTLQTFFEHRSSSNKRYKNIIDKTWFIVPYDRSGLEKVWGSSYPVSLKPIETNLPIEHFEDNSIATQMQINSNPLNSKSTANSFIAKSFQVTFEVPSTLTTSLFGYFHERANESLFGWPSSSREEALDEIKRYFGVTGKRLTPRQVKLLINQLGSLGFRWRNAFSVKSLCIYSLQKIGYSDVRPVLQNEGEEQALQLELLGLKYGNKSEDAIQMQMTTQIKQFIESGESESLRNLLVQFTDIFWLAWESINKDKSQNTFQDSSYFDFKHTDLKQQENILLTLKIAFNGQKLKQPYFDSLSIWFEGLSHVDICEKNYGGVLNKIIESCKGETRQMRRLASYYPAFISKYAEWLRKEGRHRYEHKENAIAFLRALEPLSEYVGSFFCESMGSKEWYNLRTTIKGNFIKASIILPAQQSEVSLFHLCGYDVWKFIDDDLDWKNLGVESLSMSDAAFEVAKEVFSRAENIKVSVNNLFFICSVIADQRADYGKINSVRGFFEKLAKFDLTSGESTFLSGMLLVLLAFKGVYIDADSTPYDFQNSIEGIGENKEHILEVFFKLINNERVNCQELLLTFSKESSFIGGISKEIISIAPKLFEP